MLGLEHGMPVWEAVLQLPGCTTLHAYAISIFCEGGTGASQNATYESVNANPSHLFQRSIMILFIKPFLAFKYWRRAGFTKYNSLMLAIKHGGA
jgi:hypothetical protein